MHNPPIAQEPSRPHAAVVRDATSDSEPPASGDYADSKAYLASVHALRVEARRLGYYSRPTAKSLAQFSFAAALSLGSWMFMTQTHSWAGLALAALIGGAGNLAIATVAHTASHYCLLTATRSNELVARLGYSLILGISLRFWRQKHVLTHHAAPNIDPLDGDIRIANPFALLDTVAAGAQGWRRWFIRFQWAFLPVALLLNGFAVQRNSWAQLWKERHRIGFFRDLAFLTGHYALWLGLPCLWTDFGTAALVYCLRMGVTGYFMFAAFAPAHFPRAALVADIACHTDEDFVLRQAATTLNFKTGLIGNFLCSGVQYQIEHHLLPDLNHFHYPKLAPLVREFCEARGYPYRTYSWWRGIWESVKTFYYPKSVQDGLRGNLAGALTRSQLLSVLRFT